MRRIDLTGQVFGNLTVIKQGPTKVDPNGRKRIQWECLCTCGNTVLATGDALKSGNTQSCGCYRAAQISKRRTRDLTGQTFGRWTVIEKVFADQSGAHWRCRCSCGNESVVIANNLVRGISTSCGCYNRELISARERADITDQRFGKLIAKKCVGTNRFNNCLWQCVCDCGSEVIVPATRLLIGETRSCGCASSKGEELIAKLLTILNIRFEKEFMFKDLVAGNNLRFDFAIFDANNQPHLIEYQGIQHYVDYPSGFGKRQHETDRIKREYCTTHNIPLYEIRYDDDIEKKLDEIIAQVNTVPRLSDE